VAITAVVTVAMVVVACVWALGAVVVGGAD
jgi:hypothetical protein